MKTQVSPADEASIALAGRLLREGQVVGDVYKRQGNQCQGP